MALIGLECYILFIIQTILKYIPLHRCKIFIFIFKELAQRIQFITEQLHTNTHPGVSSETKIKYG